MQNSELKIATHHLVEVYGNEAIAKIIMAYEKEDVENLPPPFRRFQELRWENVVKSMI